MRVGRKNRNLPEGRAKKRHKEDPRNHYQETGLTGEMGEEVLYI
jgi:hypothetical protein